MKKIGYTLAEILISLSLVGIIVAVTLPTFISNYRRQACASALSVAVSNFEKAMMAYIMKEGGTDIYHTEAWEQLYLNVDTANALEQADISRFIGSLDGTFAVSTIRSDRPTFLSFYDDQNGFIRNINNEQIPAVEAIGNGLVHWGMQAKNGAVYFLRFSDRGGDPASIDEATAVSQGGSLINRCAEVIIDVNGDQNPNMIGRDIFKFELDSRGGMYPCGGLDYSIKNEGARRTWQSLASRWSCAGGVNMDDNGWGCTARVIDENYKPQF